MLVVVVALLLVPSVRRGLSVASRRLALAYAGVGVVVTLHWVTFYGAIKLANASVAATCMALAPAFVALLEPLIDRGAAGARFDARQLVFGVAVIPGVVLVVGGVPAGMRPGLGVGALSAALAALFGTLNKRLVHAAHPLTITAFELGTGLVALTPFACLWSHERPMLPVPGPRDAVLLLALATACTLLPFALSLAALRHVTAYEAQLVVNLEPVYSIVLAVVLLGEHRALNGSFYAGVAMVVGVVLVYPLKRRPHARR
jgi:drug/metabolite transporter (DMT)-like permease